MLGRFKDRKEASATELSKGGRAVDEVAGLSLVRTVAFPLSEVGAFGRFDRRGPCSDSQEQKQGELRRATELVQARIPVVAVEEVTNGIWVQLESSPQDWLTDRFHSVNIYRVPTLPISVLGIGAKSIFVSDEINKQCTSVSWAFASVSSSPTALGGKVGVDEPVFLHLWDGPGNISLVRIQLRGSKDDPGCKLLINTVPGSY